MFIWERTQRLLLNPRPPARFIVGGWGNLVGAMETRARELGGQIITGERVDAIPKPPVVVALELRDARALLGDDTLRWPSGRTVCLDLGLRDRRGDPWIVSDLETAGWIERYTAQDASLAPAGEQLVQAQMPIPGEESADEAATRLERLLDASFEEWRSRVTWRRRQVMDGRSGALDFPATPGAIAPRSTAATGSCFAAIRSPQTAACRRSHSRARSKPARPHSSGLESAYCRRPHDFEPAGWRGSLAPAVSSSGAVGT